MIVIKSNFRHNEILLYIWYSIKKVDHRNIYNIPIPEIITPGLYYLAVSQLEPTHER